MQTQQKQKLRNYSADVLKAALYYHDQKYAEAMPLQVRPPTWYDSEYPQRGSGRD